MLTPLTISNLLHFRYKPKRHNFKDCKPCPVFELFDWVIWLPDSISISRFSKLRPRKVLCLAHPKSLRVLKKLRRFLKNSTVIIAGEDFNLSEVLSSVEALLPYSEKIYYEAKDIEHRNIESFCMGFNCFYLEKAGLDNIRYFRDRVSDPDWNKEGVLASWGGIWGYLDDVLEDRKAVISFLDKCDWINREKLDPPDYWKRLAESKYLIAPAGQGVQAPKLAEAWLMRTVPIVTDSPCFRDLHAEGFPVLIVDQWNNLNRDILQEFDEVMPSIDWEKIENMLTLGYFGSRYLPSDQ